MTLPIKLRHTRLGGLGVIRLLAVRTSLPCNSVQCYQLQLRLLALQYQANIGVMPRLNSILILTTEVRTQLGCSSLDNESLVI
jgi:hypothetical protein